MVFDGWTFCPTSKTVHRSQKKIVEKYIMGWATGKQKISNAHVDNKKHYYQELNQRTHRGHSCEQNILTTTPYVFSITIPLNNR